MSIESGIADEFMHDTRASSCEYEVVMRWNVLRPLELHGCAVRRGVIDRIRARIGPVEMRLGDKDFTRFVRKLCTEELRRVGERA